MGSKRKTGGKSDGDTLVTVTTIFICIRRRLSLAFLSVWVRMEQWTNLQWRSS